MTGPSLAHITMSTGHVVSSGRGGVSDDVLAVLRPWLRAAVGGQVPKPLPVPSLSHFSARVTAFEGSLLVSLFAPSGPHTPGKPSPGQIPMLTFGVAQTERQASEVWPLLVSQFGWPSTKVVPGPPWLAVGLYATVSMYRGDITWMGDFERCVAWAWITSAPTLSTL